MIATGWAQGILRRTESARRMVPIKLRIAAGALAAATGGVGFYAYRSANPSQQTAQARPMSSEAMRTRRRAR